MVQQSQNGAATKTVAQNQAKHYIDCNKYNTTPMTMNQRPHL